MKKFLSFIWEIAKIVIIALLIVIPIRYFLFQPFFVRGQSMEPNFCDGDYLIVDEISYRFRDPQRGEVIVFKNPQNPLQRYIKRITGLPGETIEIEDGKLIISKESKTRVLDESVYLATAVYTPSKGFKSISLGPDQYFVLGDNRTNSTDSRILGALSKDKIIGRVFFRAWPFAALAKIEIPTY